MLRDKTKDGRKVNEEAIKLLEKLLYAKEEDKTTLEQIKTIASMFEKVMIKHEVIDEKLADITLFNHNAVRTIEVVTESHNRITKMCNNVEYIRTSIDTFYSQVGEVRNLLKSIVDKQNRKTFKDCKKDIVKKLSKKTR